MTTEILYEQQTEDADAADDDERRCKDMGELQLKIERNKTFEYLYEVLKLLIIYIHIQ